MWISQNTIYDDEYVPLEVPEAIFPPLPVAPLVGYTFLVLLVPLSHSIGSFNRFLQNS